MGSGYDSTNFSEWFTLLANKDGENDKSYIKFPCSLTKKNLMLFPSLQTGSPYEFFAFE